MINAALISSEEVSVNESFLCILLAL